MRGSPQTQETSEVEKSGALVVLTRVEGLLRERAGCRCTVPRRAVGLLATSRVPLVLVSESPAEDVRRLQRELNLIEPFICDRGAALHFPQPYDRDLHLRSAVELRWDVFRFDPPDVGGAVTYLRGLFAIGGYTELLTVGLGCDHGDFGLLAAVDVPIVVRDRRKDQALLMREFPDAYVTTACGVAGWSEAVIGASVH